MVLLAKRVCGLSDDATRLEPTQSSERATAHHMATETSFAEEVLSPPLGSFKPSCLQSESPRFLLWHHLVPASLADDDISSACQSKLFAAASAGKVDVVMPCIHMIMANGGFEAPRFSGLDFDAILRTTCGNGHQVLLQELLLSASWLRQSNISVLWEHVDALCAACESGHAACVADMLHFAASLVCDHWSKSETKRAWARALEISAKHGSQACLDVLLHTDGHWRGPLKRPINPRDLRRAICAAAGGGHAEALSTLADMAQCSDAQLCVACVTLSACASGHLGMLSRIQALPGAHQASSPPPCLCDPPLDSFVHCFDLDGYSGFASKTNIQHALAFCVPLGIAAGPAASNPSSAQGSQPPPSEDSAWEAVLHTTGLAQSQRHEGGFNALQRLQVASHGIAGAVAYACRSGTTAQDAGQFRVLRSLKRAYMEAARQCSADDCRWHAVWSVLLPVVRHAASHGHGAPAAAALEVLFEGGAGGLASDVRIILQRCSDVDSSALLRLHAGMQQAPAPRLEWNCKALVRACAEGDTAAALQCLEEMNAIQPGWMSAGDAQFSSSCFSAAVLGAVRSAHSEVLSRLLRGGHWAQPALHGPIMLAATQGGGLDCWLQLRSLSGSVPMPVEGGCGSGEQAAAESEHRWTAAADGILTACGAHDDPTILDDACSVIRQHVSAPTLAAAVASCLVAAAKADSVAIIEYIVEGGAGGGDTLAQLLPEAPPDAHHHGTVLPMEFAFIEACRQGSLRCVQYLLTAGTRCGVLDVQRAARPAYAASSRVSYQAITAAVTAGQEAVVQYLSVQRGPLAFPLGTRDAYDLGVLLKVHASGPQHRMARYLERLSPQFHAVLPETSPTHFLVGRDNAHSFRAALTNPYNLDMLGSARRAQLVADLGDYSTQVPVDSLDVLYGDTAPPDAVQQLMADPQEQSVERLAALLRRWEVWPKDEPSPALAGALVAACCSELGCAKLRTIIQQQGVGAIRWGCGALRKLVLQVAAVHVSLGGEMAPGLPLLLTWVGSGALFSNRWRKAVKGGRGSDVRQAAGSWEVSQKLRVEEAEWHERGGDRQGPPSGGPVRTARDARAVLRHVAPGMRGHGGGAAAAEARRVLLRDAKGRELWRGNCMRPARRVLLLRRAVRYM